MNQFAPSGISMYKDYFNSANIIIRYWTVVLCIIRRYNPYGEHGYCWNKADAAETTHQRSIEKSKNRRSDDGEDTVPSYNKTKKKINSQKITLK